MSLVNLTHFFSPGPPAESHCYKDIEAAYNFLRKSLQVPAANIVLYGRSLGSGPSCHMAAGTAQRKDEDAIGGMILHAPFLSVFRIVMDTGCTIYGDKFPNIDLVPMVNSPVLVVHGTADQIVPFYHSEKLHAALPPECQVKPLFIDGMSHNNVHSAVRSMFIQRLQIFLEDHVAPGIVGNRTPTHPVEKMRLSYSDHYRESKPYRHPSDMKYQHTDSESRHESEVSMEQ